MIKCVDINDELPEYCLQVLIAYKDKDGSNSGICKASLHFGDEWLTDSSLRGEDYEEGCSKVTHWFDYQSNLNYPKEYDKY